VPSPAIQWEASSRKITDHGQLPASSPWIGPLLITFRVMLSSKQLTARDFNFGALGRTEMRNPQTDEKGASSKDAQENFGRFTARKRVTASVALRRAPADHPSVDCLPCCGASPFTGRPMTKEWQEIRAIVIFAQNLKLHAAFAINRVGKFGQARLSSNHSDGTC
jgi:hypothetical protein